MIHAPTIRPDGSNRTKVVQFHMSTREAASGPDLDERITQAQARVNFYRAYPPVLPAAREDAKEQELLLTRLREQKRAIVAASKALANAASRPFIR